MSVAASIKGIFTRRVSESLADNPVVIRDLRTRMRGMKGFTTVGAYIALLGVVEAIAITAIADMTKASLVNDKVGLSLFQTLMWTQTILLAMIVPAITSGSITTELESKTIEMAALTRLTSGRVVLGKALTGFLYATVLLLSSVPVASLCLMFGGLSPAEILSSYMVMLAWVFFLSSSGVFWSSLFKKTATATLVAYAASIPTMFYFFGLGASLVFTGTSSASQVPWYSTLCPGWIPYMATAAVGVCKLHIAVTWVPLVIYALSGVLMLFVAVMHVKHFRVDRSLQVRVILTTLCGLVAWLASGDHCYVVIPGGTKAAEILAMPFALILILAIFMIPLFVVGPVRCENGESAARYAFSFRKMFKADLGGGIPFMMLWTVVIYAVFGLTIHAYSGGRSSLFWTAYFHMGTALLACIIGLSSIGFLMSAWNSVRRNAVALYFVIVFILCIGYPCISQGYAPGQSNPRLVIWQTSALWPFTALATVVPENKSDSPAFWWKASSSWKPVTISYLAITVLSLVAASRLRKRRPGVQEDADAV